MSSRIEYIDRLKGLAILAVVMGHIIYFVFHLSDDPVWGYIYSFHVPLFIFLSGYVIFTPPHLLKLTKKIIALLMPAITIGGFLCYVTSRSFMYFVTDDMKLGYWYLFVLAFFYLLLTPFRLKLKCDKLVIKILIDAGLALGVWIVLFLLSRYVLSKNITNILSLNSCYNLWPFFILGYLFRKWDLTKEIMRRNWIFSVSLLSYVSIKLSLDNGLKMHFIPLIMSFCAIMSLFCLFGWRENKHTGFDRQLGLIGRNTLDIYIYHYFLLQMISLPLLGKWISSTGNYFIEGVLLILLSLSIAYASIVIGKTIKKSHWLGKVVYGRFF